jgi:hypothetical protein
MRISVNVVVGPRENEIGGEQRNLYYWEFHLYTFHALLLGALTQKQAEAYNAHGGNETSRSTALSQLKFKKTYQFGRPRNQW